MRYIKDHYPKFAKKIEVAYLGVPDRGVNPKSEGSVLQIVSCSFVIPVKRVHLIAQILEQVSVQVHWTHFGSGKNFEDLEKIVKELPYQIKVDLRGHVSNTDVISFYRKKPIHLFLHISESEGLPVSIQEAISFGIPVFAADAGGVREVVTEETGRLFPNEVKIDEWRDAIENFESSQYNTETFRSRVRHFWEKKFLADKNYPRFVDELKKESKTTVTLER